jgi:phenylacetate-CoA ligase
VMKIMVEARPDCTDAKARESEGAALAAHIRNIIGIGAQVIVGDPGAVERSAGKARRIVDKRPKA